MIILPARIQPMGNVAVHRVLPRRERRRVGPFVFLDEMGPLSPPAGEEMIVPPHPHIGLSTVTYLFEGRILHRDHLGSVQEIQPGAINLMSAGSGVVHSERMLPVSPQCPRLHGLQFWMALPKELEDGKAWFKHFPAELFPSVLEENWTSRLLFGRWKDQASPVEHPIRTFLLEGHAGADQTVILPVMEKEIAIYVVTGEGHIEGESFHDNTMLVTEGPREIRLHTTKDSHFVIFGGDPLDGDRFMWWNFVSSSKDKIEKAKLDWKEGRFPMIPGEHLSPVPAPQF